MPDSEGAALVPELRDCGLEFVAKKHYSSFVASDVLARLQSAQIQDVYVVGINTDFCIFDTALDAQARGCFFTYVVEEGVSSLNGRAGHREGQWLCYCCCACPGACSSGDALYCPSTAIFVRFSAGPSHGLFF